MIEIVNGLSSTSISDSSSTSQNGDGGSGFPGGGGGADPIAQIEAILNAHLGSLQWIDGAVKELEGKVKEVEGRQQQQDSGGSEASSLYETGPRRGYGLGGR
jgi:nuclear pore complex protein Nup62